MYPLVGSHSTGTLLWALGVVLGIGGGAVLATRDGHGRTRSVVALLLCALVLLAGAKGHFWVANWELVRVGGFRTYLAGGFHLPGGLLAVVLVGPLVMWMLRLPALNFADSVAPATALGIAVVRLGCFANGCCVGHVSAMPWALAFPSGSRVHYAQLGAGLIPPGASASLPVLPLSLFFALSAMVAAGVLLALRCRRRFAGQIALAGLALWASTTAMLECFRDEASLAGAPHLFEVAAVSGVVLVSLLSVLTHRRRRDELPLV